MLKKLRTYLVTGLVVTLPITVTLYIIYNLFIYLDTILKPILEPALEYIGFFYVNGMGLIVLLLIILVIGIFASNWFGKKIVAVGNTLFNKIPLVNKIYKATQQISDAIIGKQKSVFRGAVLVEYPRREMYAIGFWTEKIKGESIDKDASGDFYNIFIPTTPNPTSGYLLIVPEKDIIFLKMSVEDAIKMIISGGAVIPSGSGVLPADTEKDEKKDAGN